MYLNTQSLINKHGFVLDILNYKNKKNNNAMFVGGCVRDYLLTGKIVDDIDISTILHPNEVANLFYQYKKNNKDIDVVILDKDKSYGTIVVIINNQKYEITTTRSDINCYGRKAEVKFCNSFEEDSNRRDFTINALYLDGNGKIYDFHNGIEDLKLDKIVFIGEPEKRIKEDYLRIIRYFRFSTRFNSFDFDKKILNIIQQNLNGIYNLSRERIKSEVWKLLKYDNWYDGLYSLYKNNLTNSIFLLKKFEINKTKPKDFLSFNNEVLKLFYFFNYNKECLLEVQKNLRFTKEEVKLATFIVSLWWKTNNGTEVNTETKLLIFYDKNNLIYKCLHLFDGKIQKKLISFKEKIVPLPTSSKEIMEIGFAGKELGDAIKKLELLFINSDFKLKKEQLLTEASKYLIKN